MGYHFASLIVHTADTSCKSARQASPQQADLKTVYGTGVHVGEVLMLRTPGDHEHSDVLSCLREAFSFRRRKCQCLPQSLLFCRPSDIRGCAMSDPDHLRPDCDGAGQVQPAVAFPIRKSELCALQCYALTC